MGKAWVIVTSQQDIDSITKVKGNDFSKIQGRFDTRLSLSSANVDAVIKKRILEKTEPAAQTLRLLYEQKATIIKNLIVFNDTAEKKLYANEEDFAEVYPFVPYQFNLLVQRTDFHSYSRRFRQASFRRRAVHVGAFQGVRCQRHE